jgi:predicted oxidoreductase (fatty acid repression mutant protein)
MSGCGTILFYEDEEALDVMRREFPLYAKNVDRWSEHSSAMFQFAIWTALEDMGYGASLQHYNPLIDNAVMERWLISDKWRLIAQMPFGTPLDIPTERLQRSAPQQRRIVFGEEL